MQGEPEARQIIRLRELEAERNAPREEVKPHWMYDVLNSAWRIIVKENPTLFAIEIACFSVFFIKDRFWKILLGDRIFNYVEWTVIGTVLLTIIFNFTVVAIAAYLNDKIKFGSWKKHGE